MFILAKNGHQYWLQVQSPKVIQASLDNAALEKDALEKAALEKQGFKVMNWG